MYARTGSRSGVRGTSPSGRSLRGELCVSGLCVRVKRGCVTGSWSTWMTTSSSITQTRTPSSLASRATATPSKSPWLRSRRFYRRCEAFFPAWWRKWSRVPFLRLQTNTSNQVQMKPRLLKLNTNTKNQDLQSRSSSPGWNNVTFLF